MVKAAGADMAGYSGTPLYRKLGIKPGHRVALLDAPAGFAATLEGLPEGVVILPGLALDAPTDVVVLFVIERHELQARLDEVRGGMAQDGGFWVAWPKRASKVPTDVTEDVIREVALPTGLVDNKVCAIDEVWSGLRLVIRRENRRTRTRPRPGTDGRAS
ncbi:DUF3052 family protein [Paractinoplanes atraurantiacus]|uniref:DUF3052 domain-containing protein n=1 Tax=Paractinoplanes atraurantiacus TaxID=1036182 RepID=A0A285JWB2_9ACTN|nr:DUF3052 domain-containing protein [Actinoplanes atraurantiacus]SNY64612.1 Protein of unknown function [Actinoplanes atraurantiacus]